MVITMSHSDNIPKRIDPMDPGSVLIYIHAIQDQLYMVEEAFRQGDENAVAIYHHSVTDGFNSLAMLLSLQMPAAAKKKRHEVHMCVEYLDSVVAGREEEAARALQQITDIGLLGALMDIKAEIAKDKEEGEL